MPRCTYLLYLHFINNVLFLTTHSANGPNPCEIAKNPRYRKGPELCFDNNESVSTVLPVVNKSCLKYTALSLLCVQVYTSHCQAAEK